MKSLFDRPAAGECSAHFQAYIDLVDADNVLKCLKQQGLETMYLLRGLSEEQGDHRYAQGKWTVKEVVGHLIDMERLLAFRALWIARLTDAPQPGVSEDAWGAASNAGARPWPELWREQHVARTDHVYLLRSFTREMVDRVGMVDGQELTVRTIPWIMAGHERHHLDVLYERYGLEKLPGY